MDPKHILFAVMDGFDLVSVCHVEILVATPHFIFLILIELDIQAFEIMKQRSEH